MSEKTIALLCELLARRHELSDAQWQRLISCHPALAMLDSAGRFAKKAVIAAFIVALLAAMAAALFVVVFLSMLLAALVSEHWLTKLEPTIANIGENWLYLDMDDKCLIRGSSFLPEYLTLDVFRRPVWDCSFCANVTEVPKLAKVNPDSFYRDYVQRRIPAVITDASDSWQLNQLSYNFFKELYSDNWEQQSRCQFFPYKTNFNNLEEFFQMPKERAELANGTKPWYVGWSNCDQQVANKLRSFYSRPYFLPHEAETLGTDWVFMGSEGYGAHMHVDNVGHSSWQAQVRGSKTWKLKPPLECARVCPDLSIVVKPGQVIALDTTVWYHGTRIMPGGMSIAIGAEFD